MMYQTAVLFRTIPTPQSVTGSNHSHSSFSLNECGVVLFGVIHRGESIITP